MKEMSKDAVWISRAVLRIYRDFSYSRCC